jgi:hypothetical protein
MTTSNKAVRELIQMVNPDTLGKKAEEIKAEILNNCLSEKNVAILCKPSKSLTDTEYQTLWNMIYEEGGIRLTDDQSAKGLKWLNKQKAYGYRETDALENFSHMELTQVYNNFYPVYDVICKDENGERYFGFQYYVEGGKINIVG